ncbi:MAG: hypothetical protein ACI4XW_11530, partial [Candidatus Spyradocola sp.]
MTKHFTERQKLSKKARRALDNQARVTWGSLKPTQKKIDSAKIYNRKRFRNADQGDCGSFILCAKT